ncbi:uncharacterized protein LOC143890712 isoform X2 [Tasmannia lanceolata]|uniref:uncharacterized protein LOC143890712 isoform X2 n=1 Tax=Tasmannia lanceolata TaxID=3420 RepID=UPI0040639327
MEIHCRMEMASATSTSDLLPPVSVHGESRSESAIADSPGSDLEIASADVVINIAGNREGNSSQEVINPMHTPPPRYGSFRPRIAGKFPRSHSTGHSLIKPGEDVERFTLRLPENMRNDILKQKKNDYTIGGMRISGESVRRESVNNGGEGSSRGRNGGGFHWRSMSEKWGFSLPAGIFSRTFSIKSPKESGSSFGWTFE